MDINNIKVSVAIDKQIQKTEALIRQQVNNIEGINKILENLNNIERQFMADINDCFDRMDEALENLRREE